MLLKLCFVLLFLDSISGFCTDVNVYLDGPVHTSTQEINSTACQQKCTATRCEHWSYRNGKCDVLKLANPGRKVGKVGAEHGGSGTAQCSKQQVTGVVCHYVQSKEPVVCLFPFIGENPGQKNTNQPPHNSCLQTKKGKYWCATKLSINNELLATSNQTQDIQCGFNVSPQGEFRCLQSNCSDTAELGRYIAKLEEENRILKSQGCKVPKTNNSTTNTSTNNNTRPPVGPTPSIPDNRNPNRPTQRPTTAVGGQLPTLKKAASNADPVLGAFTEKLLSIDENNARRFITFDTGCKTRIGNPQDCSSSPLFTGLVGDILNRPIYQKLKALYENYVPQVTTVEDHTGAEQKEEKELLAEIMNTKVMKETYNFLRQNKHFNGTEQEFKNLLDELWFSVYSRGMRIKGSSGFEHVFLGEKKEGQVQGFHNWAYFFFLEKRNELNYLGHWKNVDLGGAGNALEFTFRWGQEQKPFGSMIIGTSPELEMAIYTTCLLAKGETGCAVSLGGNKVDVEVHTFSRPNNVRYIASSFFNF